MWTQSKGLWLGRVEYEDALTEQAKFYQAPPEVCFLGFETLKSTITLGRSAKLNSEVYNPNNSFQVIQADRGGQATLHSPGQLVIFPVIDVVEAGIRPRVLVEELLKFFYSKLEVAVGRELKLENDGIYTEKGKLGFIGLRIKNHQVLHGVSINVGNDLDEFKEIRSCGKDGATHDRVSDYDHKCKPNQLFKSFFPRG